MIYFDNAATTMVKPPVVIDAVVNALKSMGNSSRGTHESCLSASRVIFETRILLAELFNAAGPEHVIFTANSTEALNISIRGAIPKGSHVITTDFEHNSVLRPLYYMEEHEDVSLSFVSAGKDCSIDYDEFETLICDKTSAIVCTHASNLTGTVLDIKKIGEIAKKHGLLFIVDASQSAGVLPINMKEMNIDCLCFTGHKGLYGPQGTGGLCIGNDVNIRPFKVGGTGVKSYLKTQPDELPTLLEAGTLNGHGIAGLNAAIKFLNETGIENIHKKETELLMLFYNSIKDFDGIKIYGDFSVDKTAVLALNIKDYDSGFISDILASDYGIATRPGAHCAPRMHEALKTVSQGAVRFSFSYFNTKEEVLEAVKVIKEICDEPDL